MKTQNRVSPTANHLKHHSLALALGLAASAAFLAEIAHALTTINSGATLNTTDPNTCFGGAGILTINDGATLNITGAQAPPPTGYNIGNVLIFAGNADTIINHES